jgi:anti-anti-sigma factor
MRRFRADAGRVRVCTTYSDHVTALRRLERAVDLDHGDHVAWAYDERADLCTVLADTFTEAAGRGEQLIYVGNRDRAGLCDDLADLDGRDAMMENGRLRVHSIAELYHATGRFEPRAQVETFRAEAQRAVRAGYHGLRVVGDVTDLVTDGAGHAAFVDYELALEAMYAVTPVTGICAFDRHRLGEQWREIAALHRLQHAAGQGPGFALTYASGAVRLFGELDASSAAEFQRLLDAVLAATTGVLEVDHDRLDFIDVSASRVLAEARQTMACANRDLQLTGVRRAAVLPLAAFNLHGGAPR